MHTVRVTLYMVSYNMTYLAISKWEMQNKFPDNENYLKMTYIKSKRHFLPTSNMTEKIEFVSQIVYICEPETFGLLLQN